MPTRIPSPTLPSPVWLGKFRRQLLAWYRKHQRDLPWRSTHDPYSIWVSEIMLQQTQVATVLPHYHRFIARFPDVGSLAAAEEADVLKYWEGLGYYRRARQMLAAARLIEEQYAGVFPNEYNKILDLPGIGRYTAGAICSFAYDQKTPIVEANTQRLYARLMALRESLATASGQRYLWSFAEAILPSKNVRGVNQAVMELGALVCLPKPRCDECPVADLCPTKRADLQNQIPRPRDKTRFENKHDWVLIVRDKNGRYLVRQCEPGEWWTGLWDFPRFPAPDELLKAERRKDFKLQPAYTAFGESFCVTSQRFQLKHAVTKYRITLSCFDATWNKTKRSPRSKPAPQNGTSPSLKWVTRLELDELPMSSIGRKIVKRLGA